MPSELGSRLKKARTDKEIGLRELARRVNKSPAFLTQLENESVPPAAAEETLRSIARALDLDPDEIFVLAKRSPQELVPASTLEMTLYRRVKNLSKKEKLELLRRLDVS